MAWNSCAGATGYLVFMRQDRQSYNYTNPNWEGKATSCTIAALREKTRYYFVVRAYDGRGNESGDSNEIGFYYDPLPPDAPLIRRPADNAHNVDLTPELSTSPFRDANAQNRHAATQWRVFRSADDLVCFSLTSDFFLSDLPLPPLVLDETTDYYWTVCHTNQLGVSSNITTGHFCTAHWDADGNANGIPDYQEVDSPLDLDRNGQPDQRQPRMKCLKSAVGDVNISIGLSSTSPGAILFAAQALDQRQVDLPYAGAVDLPVGLLNFKLLTANEGDRVNVTVYFSSSIPDAGDWIAGSLQEGYKILRSADFSANDGRSVTLHLQDGGDGDLDGVQNGIIVTLGGYSALGADTHLNGSGSSGSAGGGGGCFINSLLRF